MYRHSVCELTCASDTAEGCYSVRVRSWQHDPERQCTNSTRDLHSAMRRIQSRPQPESVCPSCNRCSENSSGTCLAVAGVFESRAVKPGIGIPQCIGKPRDNSAVPYYVVNFGLCRLLVTRGWSEQSGKTLLS